MGKELKRMNYFNGLLLGSEDYSQDKNYQRRLQGLHNRYLHTWGIFSGLDVKPVTDSNMEVYVTEGVALDLTSKGLDGLDIEESVSRQILIYEGHPDNPIDLSEYNAGDNIYIFAAYAQCNADWDSERGQGKEIHVWERGRLGFSTEKPKDLQSNLLLARVVPREISSKAGSITFTETIIDSTCIFYTDTDGTPLRVYGGPFAKVLGLEKFIFKLNDNLDSMPFIKSYTNNSNLDLEVNSKQVNFTGDVTVTDDVEFARLVSKKKNGAIEPELKFAEKFMQLNSIDDDSKDIWKLKDGGIDVFRGGSGPAPDGRIVWSEADGVWKAGLENKLFPIAYGDIWNELISSRFNDGLHMHGKLSYSKGTALSVDENGSISVNGNLTLNNKNIGFAAERKSGEVAWYGNGKLFENKIVDGTVMAGSTGGLLGTAADGQKAVLSWTKIGKYQKVGIGSLNLCAADDDIDIAGSCRLLVGSNPIRFTSVWTAFPDLSLNQAEICNDTTYHKALMLVGNQSAGQGRKVAMWDRLDVNGLLYTNGSLQISNKLTVSAGKGNNGIIFPSDPGGGSGDAAWLKYYPKTGESCIFEIGTSNDGDDNILLMPSGNVGIGTWTSDNYISSWAPNDMLDVRGNMCALSGTNPIRFTSLWNPYNIRSQRHAEICNDTSAYKALVIAGNMSGGYERRVSIWDDLDVNGPLAVRGKMQVNGAIVPGVGNCEVKGIMFPKDPAGGGGDAAWIRYYSDRLRGGGENMTLEIGISNDSNIEQIPFRYFTPTCPYPWVTNKCGYWTTGIYNAITNRGDRLLLRASGGVYIDGNFYYTSSKQYKENITALCADTVHKTIENLEPVEFNFKGDSSKTTLGFIAEDVPDNLAAFDKKAISPMEIIAVLASEVKNQESILNELKKKIATLKGRKK